MQRVAPPFGRSLVAALTGAASALLLARLLVRLLAARPDSPSFELLLAVTWPLVAPLALLDRGQPQFGATLELSTLVMAIFVPVAGYLVWVLLGGATATPRRASK